MLHQSHPHKRKIKWLVLLYPLLMNCSSSHLSTIFVVLFCRFQWLNRGGGSQNYRQNQFHFHLFATCYNERNESCNVHSCFSHVCKVLLVVKQHQLFVFFLIIQDGFSSCYHSLMTYYYVLHLLYFGKTKLLPYTSHSGTKGCHY